MVVVKNENDYELIINALVGDEQEYLVPALSAMKCLLSVEQMQVVSSIKNVTVQEVKEHE